MQAQQGILAARQALQQLCSRIRQLQVTRSMLQQPSTGQQTSEPVAGC